MHRVLYLLAAMGLSLLACGEADDDVGPGAGGSGATGGTGGGGMGGSPAVTWGACPNGAGECATFDVPLDWETHDGEEIPFFVRRLPATTQPAAGQLWLLQGGPGTAGWNLAKGKSLFDDLVPNHDIYITDYRGTGHSAWLGCESAPGGTLTSSCFSELEDRWGAGLEHFSTGAAARDIHHAIEAVRQPDQRVLLWSNSYGTFVANRLLTLFPEVADAAVMDSVCSPAGCDVRKDRNQIAAAETVFAACAADATCSEKLGAEPFARFVAVLESSTAGHCPAFFDDARNRQLFPFLVLGLVDDVVFAPVATATVYRAERCESGDVQALEHLVGLVDTTATLAEAMPSGEFSDYLLYQVMFSEFWPEGLDPAAVTLELAELPFATGHLQGWSEQREAWPWPLLSTPAAEKRWSGTRIPLLLMNGGLDTSTPVSALDDVEASFVAASQQLVIFPFTGHGVTTGSATTSTLPLSTCGMDLTRAFFADPATPVDTTCVQESPSIDFRGVAGLAAQAFGTADLWENAASTTRAASPPAQANLAERIRRMVDRKAPW